MKCNSISQSKNYICLLCEKFCIPKVRNRREELHLICRPQQNWNSGFDCHHPLMIFIIGSFYWKYFTLQYLHGSDSSEIETQTDRWPINPSNDEAAKIFENLLNPSMLVFIGKILLSTLRWVPKCQGFNDFSVCLHQFVLAKLAISIIRVKIGRERSKS